MPYRRKKVAPRRRYKKRSTRRRNNYARSQLYGSRALLPLGKVKKMKLRYCEIGTAVDPGVAGIPAVYVYKANSLFDPNDTGTGHQPMGFDQVMPFFDKYMVIHAAIRVSFANSETSNNDGLLVAIKISDDSSGISNLQDEIERGLTKYKIMSAASGDNGTCVMTSQVSPHKFLGISNPTSNENLKGTISTSPTEGVYFQIIAQPMSGTNVAAVRLSVQIDFTALFMEPKDLTTS